MNQEKCHRIPLIHQDLFLTKSLGEGHRDAVYWFDLTLAQNLGRALRHTISNAIIFDDTMLAECLVKIIRRRTHRILYQKARSESQHTPQLFFAKDGSANLGAWDAGGSSKDQLSGKNIGEKSVTLVFRVHTRTQGVSQKEANQP